jgi:hypothetical protein
MRYHALTCVKDLQNSDVFRCFRCAGRSISAFSTPWNVDLRGVRARWYGPCGDKLIVDHGST